MKAANDVSTRTNDVRDRLLRMAQGDSCAPTLKTLLEDAEMEIHSLLVDKDMARDSAIAAMALLKHARMGDFFVRQAVRILTERFGDPDEPPGGT